MDFKREHLSSSDVMVFKDRVIDRWKPTSDVWALKYGDEILGSLTTFGSLYITHFFRKELKIRPFAPLTCYLPVIGVSAVAVTLFHISVISKNVLNRGTCPTCVVIKGGIGQMLGLGYTLVAAPTVCFYIADRLVTYPIPPLLRAPREVFALYKKIVMKYSRPVSILGAFYMVSACFITYQKYQNLKTMDLESKRP